MKNIFILTAIALVFAGCNKDPVACFTLSATTVEMLENITATNCSEDSESSDWDLGDSRTMTDDNLTFSYPSYGIYTLNLKAWNKKKKDFDQLEETITVNSYAEKFLGTYSVSEVRTGGNCDTTITYTLMITQDVESNGITYENLANNFAVNWPPYGTVLNNDLVPINFNGIMGDDNLTYNVNTEGATDFDGTTFTMIYSVSDQAYANICGNTTMNITATKQ